MPDLKLIPLDDCSDKHTFLAYSFPVVGSDGVIYEYDSYRYVFIYAQSESDRLGKRIPPRSTTVEVPEIDPQSDELKFYVGSDEVKMNFAELRPVNKTHERFIALVKAHLNHLVEFPPERFIEIADDGELKIKTGVDVSIVELVDIKNDALPSKKGDETASVLDLLYSVDFRVRLGELEQADLALPDMGWDILEESVVSDNASRVECLLRFRQGYGLYTPDEAVQMELSRDLEDKLKKDEKYLLEKALSSNAKGVLRGLLKNPEFVPVKFTGVMTAIAIEQADRNAYAVWAKRLGLSAPGAASAVLPYPLVGCAKFWDSLEETMGRFPPLGWKLLFQAIADDDVETVRAILAVRPGFGSTTAARSCQSGTTLYPRGIEINNEPSFELAYRAGSQGVLKYFQENSNIVDLTFAKRCAVRSILQNKLADFRAIIDYLSVDLLNEALEEVCDAGDVIPEAFYQEEFWQSLANHQAVELKLLDFGWRIMNYILSRDDAVLLGHILAFEPRYAVIAQQGKSCFQRAIESNKKACVKLMCQNPDWIDGTYVAQRVSDALAMKDIISFNYFSRFLANQSQEDILKAYLKRAAVDHDVPSLDFLAEHHLFSISSISVVILEAYIEKRQGLPTRIGKGRFLGLGHTKEQKIAAARMLIGHLNHTRWITQSDWDDNFAIITGGTLGKRANWITEWRSRVPQHRKEARQGHFFKRPPLKTQPQKQVTRTQIPHRIL